MTFSHSASELLIAVGGSLTFGTYQENGATFVTGTIKDNQATLFPAGSLHFQQNQGCEVRARRRLQVSVADINRHLSSARPVHCRLQLRGPRTYRRCSRLLQEPSCRHVRVHHTLTSTTRSHSYSNSATLGDIGVQEVTDIAGKIPKNVAWGVQECITRCGLDRAGQWTPEAVAHAKRQFTEFMEQGPINARDFEGLPMVKV